MEIARSAQKVNLQMLINNHYGYTGYIINEDNLVFNTNLCKLVSDVYVEQKDGYWVFSTVPKSS